MADYFDRLWRRAIRPTNPDQVALAYFAIALAAALALLLLS